MKKFTADIWVHHDCKDDENYYNIYRCGDKVTKADIKKEVIKFLKEKRSKVLTDFKITES